MGQKLELSCISGDGSAGKLGGVFFLDEYEAPIQSVEAASPNREMRRRANREMRRRAARVRGK
ncbi:hypothetical protein WV31_10655 [Magnetospirillum sp. ME-1]|uniref:hypothetical protein n=1 Tax=Magnetospirillum sp. ME-1 TaxID=1639348 RepID=UPI000A17CACE|nr:hypothetical protein [Magnetospirillum sp. ME-1]ARJ66087.1 hypothetical protein WV31_10655 [Magnetospirillum sp. ME-1]